MKDPLTEEDSVSITAYYIHNNTFYVTDETLNSLFIQPPVAPMNDFSIHSVALTSYLTSDIVDLIMEVEKDSGELF